MPVSVSWPANEPSFSASVDVGLQLRRLLGRDRGHVERVDDGAGQQVVRHLLGDLQRHVLLRLAGRGAEMRRARPRSARRTAALSLAGSSANTSKRRAGDVAASRAASRSAASSTSPPRAQLMMRTPFLVFARFARDEDVAWSARSAACAA